MTDSEKLDLLLEKMSNLDKRVSGIEKDNVDIKTDIKKLHRMDELILDEVERVHTLLNKHIEDITKHTA